MQAKTKDTIIRHLKGIVAALEKEETSEGSMAHEIKGKKLEDCTDEEIQQAWTELKNIDRAFPADIGKWYYVLKPEADKRNIVLDR